MGTKSIFTVNKRILFKKLIYFQKVILTSAFTKKGISELWDSLCEYRDTMNKQNEIENKRQMQLKLWFWTHLKENLVEKILAIEDLKNELVQLEQKVVSGSITPGQAADCIINRFFMKK